MRDNLRNAYYTFRLIPYMWKYLRGNWYVFRDCPDNVLQWLHEAYLEMDLYNTSEVAMFVEEGEAEYRIRKSKRT